MRLFKHADLSLMFMGKSFFVILFFLSFASNCFAERLPLWELGGAIGAAKLPYYRGSAESRNVALPLPLAMYRGEKYQVDKDGARRWLFKTDRMRLDVSMALGLPVPKDANVEVRTGMPALHTMLEVGPVLDVMLWRGKKQSLSLHFPLRMATSLNWLDSKLEGLFFSPYMHYAARSYSRNYWEFNLSAGPQYGSKDYHSYYYSVEPQYATTTREEYAARAGYSGSRITVYVNKRLGSLWMSAFARYDFLSDAVFNDSPLVEKKNYLIGGFVVGWVFLDSPRTVVMHQPEWFD